MPFSEEQGLSMGGQVKRNSSEASKVFAFFSGSLPMSSHIHVPSSHASRKKKAARTQPFHSASNTDFSLPSRVRIVIRTERVKKYAPCKAGIDK
jgi:hypothetical protein